MLEEYSLNGICFMADELITLEKALLKDNYLRYYSELDPKTLGYIRYGEYREYRDEFIPVTHKGRYLKSVG